MEILAGLKVPFWANLLLTLIGMFLYNIAIIRSSSRINKFSDIKIAIWWDENQIRFTMATMIIAVIFAVSIYYDTLTVERSLCLGVVGNLALDKFLKFVSKPSDEQPG